MERSHSGGLSYPKITRTRVEKIDILISLFTIAIVFMPQGITRETWSSTTHSAVMHLLVQAHVDFTHMTFLDFKVTAGRTCAEPPLSFQKYSAVP